MSDGGEDEAKAPIQAQEPEEPEGEKKTDTEKSEGDEHRTPAPKRSVDSGVMHHGSSEERAFFAPPEPAVTNVTDDFSDLEEPFRTKGNKVALIVTLLILGLVVLGGGGYLVHRFWLDPYAQVDNDEKLMRPVQTKKKVATRKALPREISPKKPTRDVEARKNGGEKPGGGDARETPPPTEPAGPSEEVKAKAKKALAQWKKNRGKAVKLLEEVVKAYPQHKEAKEKLGSYYEVKAWSALNNGAHATSLKMARKAISYDLRATKAWFCMGFVSKKKGKNAEAKKAFNTYLNLCKSEKCSMKSYAKRYLKSL